MPTNHDTYPIISRFSDEWGGFYLLPVLLLADVALGIGSSKIWNSESVRLTRKFQNVHENQAKVTRIERPIRMPLRNAHAGLLGPAKFGRPTATVTLGLRPGLQFAVSILLGLPLSVRPARYVKLNAEWCVYPNIVYRC